MCLKVATIISLFTITFGELLSHAMQQLPPKQAMSSQSYHRDDVPLSYKFSSIHAYTTPKPLKAGHEPHVYYQPAKANLDPRDFRSIQYAPLLNPAQYDKLSVPRSQQSRPKLNENTLKKAHLEPKYVNNNSEVRSPQTQHLEYEPGKNIRVMQSVNRIPGNNVIYKSYSDNIPNDKLNQLNYLRQYIVYQNAQRQADLANQNLKNNKTNTSTTVIPKYEEFSQVPLLRPIGHLFTGPKTNTYEFTRDKSKFMNIEVPYASKAPAPKMHALFLNVARSYNFVPAGIHPGSNPVSILGKSQTLPLLRIPGLSLEIPPRESKTLLFPMQKSRHFAINS